MPITDPYVDSYFNGWNGRSNITERESSIGSKPYLEYRESDPILNTLINNPEEIFQMDEPFDSLNTVLNEDLIESNPELFKRAYLSVIRYIALNVEDKESILTFYKSLIITQDGQERKQISNFLYESGLIKKTGAILECLNLKPRIYK